MAHFKRTRGSEKDHLISNSATTNADLITKPYGSDFELVSSSSNSISSPFQLHDRDRDDSDRGEEGTPPLCHRIATSVWFPIGFVLAFTFFITVVEHGVRFNVIVYTEDVLNYTRGNSPILIAAFDAIAPCLPLIGGWLADSRVQRLKVIAIGTLITLFGVILLTINVGPYPADVDENFSITAKRSLFVIGFSFIFVGLALYEANDYVLAAREMEARGDSTQLRTLFCVFYMVYFGAVFVSELLFRLINATSFFFVYVLMAALVLAALMSILLGRNYYVTESRSKYALRNQLKIIWEGVTRRKAAPNVESWLDRATEGKGGSFSSEAVFETKHLLRTTPIFHTVTIFIIVNYFIDITYPDQTTHMTSPIDEGNNSTALFAYRLYRPLVSLFTNVITLTVLFPCMHHCGRCISPFVRIGAGIVFGMLSVLSAAIVETARKRVMVEIDGELVTMVNNITSNSSSLNAVTQVPQYTCAGIGEALVLTAGVEVSYVEAPCHLKGFTVGLFLLMSGVGSYILAQLIVAIVNGISGAAGQVWYSDDVNSGQLEYFYYVLAGVLVLDVLYLYLVTRTYKQVDWNVIRGPSMAYGDADDVMDGGQKDGKDKDGAMEMAGDELIETDDFETDLDLEAG